MSTYAIGDIHGCLDQLRRLIETLREEENLQSNDTLVFIGDYIDRGPDSKGVIDYLIELSKNQRCVFLMGNHEDMMLWWLKIQHGPNALGDTSTDRYASAWILNGGGETLESYGVNTFNYIDRRDELVQAIPESHLGFLKSLVYYYIEGSNLFVHGGISFQGLRAGAPKEAIEQSQEEDILWDREAYHLDNDFGTLIYGHTPNKKGIRWNRREDGSPFSVGLDVGCVFDCNPLIAVRTDDWAEIWPDF